MTELTTTIERPVKAKLLVALENGETFPATEEHLRRFGFVDRNQAYYRFCDWLRSALGVKDLTATKLNVIRYAVECACCYDRMPGDTPEDAHLLEEVRSLVSTPDEALLAELLEAGTEAWGELRVWLDEDCDCDACGPHICGKPRVEATRDRLRGALSQVRRAIAKGGEAA